MAATLLFIAAFMVFTGVVIWVLTKGIRADTWDHDMNHIWTGRPINKGQYDE